MSLDERRDAAVAEIKAVLEKYQLEIAIKNQTMLMPIEQENTEVVETAAPEVTESAEVEAEVVAEPEPA